MALVSLPGEINTVPIIEWILAEGKTLVLPRVDPALDQLRAYEVRSLGHDLSRQGKLRILEPLPTRCRPAVLSAIELVLMPGLLFDVRGGRLGYGAGYFDRFLASICPMPPRIAVAFDFQLVTWLPQTDYDVPISGVVTETGAWRVREARWDVPSPAAMHAAARELDAFLPERAVVALCGELGAGKTEWTRGFFAPQLAAGEEVVSPTYALHNVYAGSGGALHHIDLYRLEGGAEGFPELPEILASTGRHVVEWADRAPGAMPREVVWIDITIEADGSRRVVARWMERVDGAAW